MSRGKLRNCSKCGRPLPDLDPLTSDLSLAMFLAKVTGSLVATQKVDAMRGQKLLVVEPFRLDPETHTKLVTTGRSFVTVDTLGAGVGELVLITQGSSARFTPETKELPIDTVIIGIVDRVDAAGRCVFDHDKD